MYSGSKSNVVVIPIPVLPVCGALDECERSLRVGGLTGNSCLTFAYQEVQSCEHDFFAAGDCTNSTLIYYDAQHAVSDFVLVHEKSINDGVSSFPWSLRSICLFRNPKNHRLCLEQWQVQHCFAIVEPYFT